MLVSAIQLNSNTLLIVLVIISVLINLISAARNRRSDENENVTASNTEVKSVSSVPAKDNKEEVVAAISAAIAMMYEGSDTKYVIRYIKPAKKNGERPIWAQIGIQNNTKAF